MNQNHLPAREAPPTLQKPEAAAPPGAKFRAKLKKALNITTWEWIIFGVMIPAGFYAFLAGIGIILMVAARADLPDPESLQTFKPALTTKVFDRSGELVFEFYEERRDPLPLDSMPAELVDAFVAVEDKRFFQHWGVSLPDIARAMVRNLAAGRIVQGGSTITQLLARNMFLTQERTWIRKFKEIVLAIELEKMYSKDEILEMCLNQVYFGHGAYGVEAASQRFFDKPVAELNVPEMCMLVGLPKGGYFYLPYDYPEKVRARRDIFITALYENDFITSSEYEEALATGLELAERKIPPNEAPYFTEEIRRYLERKYGAGFIYREGVYIYTTLDLEMQRTANRVFEEQMLRIESTKNLEVVRADYDTLTFTDDTPAPEYLQGALVAMDTHTGEILAMIGGRDYRQSSFNRATQAKRQPGSSFKVFVYTAAIDNGFTLADIEFDAPVMIRTGGSLYAPANWDYKFYGPMTLRQGLAMSRNLIAVRLTRYVGPEMVAEYAHLMGIKSPLKPVLSIGLGAMEVSPLEMATAFCTLPNQGRTVEPTYIYRIVGRDGEIIEEWFPQQGEEVLSPQTAFLVTSMMRSVVDAPGGTAQGVRRRGVKGPVAGKTGTTDDFTDAWFVGFTPDISCAVWVGFDQKQTIYRGASGGSCAAPIWAYFMAEATDTLQASQFHMPEGIISRPICTLTGELATADCPNTRVEYFTEGTEPTSHCQYHRLQKLRGGSREQFFELDRRSFPGLTQLDSLEYINR